ncbi:hypothetical protein BHM03_00062985 [Ensete ventricosum]|nr:hypothetical protein BHM03_00062985 [Ensete ventricosum]
MSAQAMSTNWGGGPLFPLLFSPPREEASPRFGESTGKGPSGSEFKCSSDPHACMELCRPTISQFKVDVVIMRPSGLARSLQVRQKVHWGSGRPSGDSRSIVVLSSSVGAAPANSEAVETLETIR